MLCQFRSVRGVLSRSLGATPRFRISVEVFTSFGGHVGGAYFEFYGETTLHVIYQFFVVDALPYNLGMADLLIQPVARFGSHVEPHTSLLSARCRGVLCRGTVLGLIAQVAHHTGDKPASCWVAWTCAAHKHTTMRRFTHRLREDDHFGLHCSGSSSQSRLRRMIIQE